MTNPFNQPDKVPAVSFKDALPGASWVCRVLSAPETAQGSDFATRAPLYWDQVNRGAKTTVPNDRPVKCAVIRVNVNGEDRAIWATIPSALFAAVKGAQDASGVEIGPGGTLTIAYTGDKANREKPGLAPAKQFSAHYSAPAASANPLAGSTSQFDGFTTTPGTGTPASVPGYTPPAYTPATQAAQAAQTAPPAAGPNIISAAAYEALRNTGADMSLFAVAAS